jgi:hypothetical protein
LSYTCEPYSDPRSLDESTVAGVAEYEADNDGVSDVCAIPVHLSVLMDFNVQPSDLRDKLEAMTNVNPDVEVTRTRVATTDTVGYEWLITFKNNHGDLEDMVCDDSALVDANGVATATCVVAEDTKGSMLGGTFSIHDSVWYEAGVTSDAVATALFNGGKDLGWSISAAALKNALEAAVTVDGASAFGTVNVVRTAYFADATGKWSGGFEWAVTFLDRIGNVPPMEVIDTDVTTTGNTKAVTLHRTVRNGNELHGLFSLTFRGVSSGNVFGCDGMYWTDANCDLGPGALQDQINDSLFGDPAVTVVEVSRNDQYYDKAGGKQWFVTFVHQDVGADVPNLEPGFEALGGSQANVEVEEHRRGNQLVGTFRLRLDNYETGEIQFDASEEQMEEMLNSLVTIRPSKVKVTRTSETSANSQVRAFVWSVTFTSATWHDPTDHSTAEEGPEGNWGFDSPATWGDTWGSSGHSKAWGRNVGNVNAFSCVQSSLSTTLTGYAKNCVVNEDTPGTAPVGGTFSVTFDTSANVGNLHWTVNTANDGSESAVKEQGTYTSAPIAHDAVATRKLSASDGTSVEEILEAMPNIGDVDVSRSAVDPLNGGYAWTITFLRDGDTCEEYETASGLCNAPGNVPKLAVDGASTLLGDGTSVAAYDAQDAATVAVAATCVEGVILRGRFATFRVTGDTLAPTGLDDLLWNAGKSDVKAYLEAQKVGRTVEVDSRRIHSKYGSVEWLVRFTANPGQYPWGAGDVADAEVVGDAQLLQQLDGGTVQILEKQKGSAGLSGTFTIDVSSPLGPLQVRYDEDESRLARKLNAMSTVGAVDVRRYEYPSPSAGGWGREAVPVDGTRGGYQWNVRFLSNPGSYDGLTFPPGAGNVETIQVNDGDLGGESVMVEVVEHGKGSAPLGGTFSLSFDDKTTLQLPYSASGLEVSDELESLPSIGKVTASRHTHVASKIPGVYAVVKRDASSISLVTDAADDTADDPSLTLRRYMTHGDSIRIGGQSGLPKGLGLQGTNGDYTLEGAFTVPPFSPVVSTSVSQTQVLTAGETVRLAGEMYTVARTGTEKQVLSLASQDAMVADTGLGFRFQLHRNGYTQLSACIKLWSADEADIQETVNGMDFFDTTDDDVIVTSAEDTDAASNVYFIYFEGPSAQGNVDELSLVDCSDAAATIADYVEIETVTEGGHVEIQDIVLATGSGTIEGLYFKLGYGVGVDPTDCIAWGASAEDVKEALYTLDGIGDPGYEVLVSRVGSGNSLAEIQQLTLTSDLPVEDQVSAGGYRLRWNHNGLDAITDCIPYHATSADVETALNNMHCENGVCLPSCDACDNAVVSGHVRVAREGDGSSLWGYGYRFTFTFKGPDEGELELPNSPTLFPNPLIMNPSFLILTLLPYYPNPTKPQP